MGHVQPTYGPVTDNTHLTTGGSTVLVNGQERDAILATYEGMTCATAPLSNEDDSNCVGVYQRASYAGS